MSFGQYYDQLSRQVYICQWQSFHVKDRCLYLDTVFSALYYLFNALSALLFNGSNLTFYPVQQFSRFM